MRSETKTSMAGSWFTSLWSDVFCILFSKLLHLRTCVKVRSMSLHLTLQSSLMLLNNVHSKVSFQVLPLGKRKLFGFLKPSISGSTKIWSAFVKEKEMEMLAMFTSLDKVLNCLLPLVVRLLQITFFVIKHWTRLFEHLAAEIGSSKKLLFDRLWWRIVENLESSILMR